MDEQLFATVDNHPANLVHDPYVIAWKLLKRGTLAPVTVGHVPREVSRFVYMFMKRGGQLKARVIDNSFYRSPIPQGGLEIKLESTFVIEEEKKRYLLHLRDLIAGNYEDANEARVVEQSDSNEANPVEVPELVDFEESVIVLEDGEDELK